MLREVITPHEPFGTLWAFESLLTCVGSPVSLQLVTPGESLTTKHPVAHKRSFSSMPAEMRSQMRCFAINFTTPFNVTDVLLLFSWFITASAFPFPAVGTGTCNPSEPLARLHLLIRSWLALLQMHLCELVRTNSTYRCISNSSHCYGDRSYSSLLDFYSILSLLLTCNASDRDRNSLHLNACSPQVGHTHCLKVRH